MKLKGMILDVLRHASVGAARASDCTNGGISGKFSEVLLVGPGVPEIFEETPDRPPVVLGMRCGRQYLRPIDEPRPGHNGWMMGGNFAYSCDSRFGKFSEYPLPIHDRQEAAQ